MKKSILLLIAVMVLVVSFILLYGSNNQSFYFEENIDVKTELLPVLGNLSLYNYYSNIARPYTDDYSLYVLNPYDDRYLNDYFKNMTYDEIIFFCQNIPYESETDTAEYPKYPIETIIDNCGDCEDKSILCANILSLFGYNVSLVRFDSHMMVLVDDVLIEVTGRSNKYILEDAICTYPIISHSILVLEWNGTLYSYENNYFISLNIIVYNYGDIIGNTTLRISDGINYYDFPLSVNVFSVSLIDLNIKVSSEDIDCELKHLSKR